jgi:hypothetical protein
LFAYRPSQLQTSPLRLKGRSKINKSLRAHRNPANGRDREFMFLKRFLVLGLQNSQKFDSSLLLVLNLLRPNFQVKKNLLLQPLVSISKLFFKKIFQVRKLFIQLTPFKGITDNKINWLMGSLLSGLTNPSKPFHT